MSEKVKKKGVQYFTQDTEDAIVLYNNTSDPNIRSKIYGEKIHYAFFKLTQNIIHTFKYYHTEVDNIEDLQHEVIEFLLKKIHRFDPTKGYKAYSYFGTIAKRYLINENKKNYKKKVIKAPVDVLETDENYSYDLDEIPATIKLNNFIDKFVEHCTNNIYTLFPKKDDAKIADAVLEIFRKRDNIDVFNKKALYIYIREIIDVKTPKITKISDQLFKIFKDNYLFYLENGYTKF
jgi:hypothetical protein